MDANKLIVYREYLGQFQEVGILTSEDRLTFASIATLCGEGFAQAEAVGREIMDGFLQRRELMA